MLVLIFIISIVNLGLGYWLALHLGSPATASVNQQVPKLQSESIELSDDQITEILNKRQDKKPAAKTVAPSEPAASGPPPTPATQVEYGPAEQDAASEKSPEEPDDDNDSGEAEANVLAGIESFREQLSEAAEAFPKEALQPVASDDAKANEQDEPPSESEADEASSAGQARIDNVDDDVMAGIEAFRSQLAAMKSG